MNILADQELQNSFQSFSSKNCKRDIQSSRSEKLLAETSSKSAFSVQADFSRASIKFLAEQIDQCRDVTELYCLVERELKHRGISNFLLLPCNETAYGHVDATTCLSNWPVSMWSIFCELKLFERIVPDSLRQSHQDKGMFHCSLTQAIEPFWQSRLYQFSQLEKIDQTIGCVCSAQFPKNSKMLCLFSGKSCSDEAFTTITQELGQLLVDTFSTLNAGKNESRPTLSKRELECIQWTSEGKTSYEIAIILCLSEHTINNYIATVSRKLGATNRAHLMSIAHRMKLVN